MKEGLTPMKLNFPILGLAACAFVPTIWASQQDWHPLPIMLSPGKPSASPEYLSAIKNTARMAHDGKAQRLANAYGLSVLNLTWEDTGRYKNSAVGPNISDMTIQVGVENSLTREFEVSAMPVIRFPNFSDKSCDLDPSDFTLLVGNEKGKTLKRVSLREFLRNPELYLSDPSSWRGPESSLLADRDSKVLVSAQACFLPVPKTGKATFNPVLFNYQSMEGDPAVLTILATREGTSVTVIDNKRDAFAIGSLWGQRLFHNKNGMRASLTGERLSDFEHRTGTKTTSARAEGMSMVLLIQVPLKQKRPMRSGAGVGGGFGGAPETSSMDKAAKSRESDTETAVIGHGEIEGPFTEIDNLSIERDARFPVRVTVQFYKATSTGVMSETDIKAISSQINRVYSSSESVGSLVTGGRTGRVTEYEGAKVQPKEWWAEFWRLYESNMNESRGAAIARLKKLLGENYQRTPVCDLYLRDLLRGA